MMSIACVIKVALQAIDIMDDIPLPNIPKLGQITEGAESTAKVLV